MKPSELVMDLEDYRHEAYPDPYSPRGKHRRATGHDDPTLDGSPWTYGYGQTGPSVQEGSTISLDAARSLLEHVLVGIGLVVDDLVQVPITASQRAALMSFAYNEGTSTLSSPLCHILNHLNRGDHLSAAGQFMHFTLAGGVHGALKARRMREIEAFLSDFVVFRKG